ncbi:MAG: SusC/RagA family TonB-linked outer membrane protein [Prolixibacteraceae bacterium]|nr:SusC/RagA family TonB-linked outer membrane protein [Prolixibacteraceae bacterium]
MKKKYYIILAFLCGIILFQHSEVFAQKEKLITIASAIVDGNGNPIKNAEIFSGSAYTKTDANGKFTVSVVPKSKLIVEAAGYENSTFTIDEVQNKVNISLKTSPFLYGSDDMVDLAFRRVHKGDVVGAFSTINGDKVNAYDNTIWASNVLNGRTLGMLGSSSIRGIGIGINVADETGSGLFSGNALFIVDGLPRDIESLRLSEIEDITVLKDINTSILYDSAAVNGVILITTKRGEAFKKQSNFSVNYGISTPRALPKFLNSAEYMTYYNQARLNDGKTETFNDEEIENYRSGNKYRYPDVDYYSDEYLKPLKNYFDLEGQFSGGNDVAKYYSNVGWYSSGGYLNFGEGANARNNVFNVRGNVDLKVNDWIKTSVDGVSLFGNDRSQRGNYWSSAASIRPHLYTPLLPIDLIDPENSLLNARKNDVNGEYLIGGNSNYITTPFGDGYAGGVYERIFRKFSFNNRIDFDLNAVTQGLSFHTNISFDYFTAYDQTVYNQYSVYEPVWAENEDIIVDLKQHGKDERPGTQAVGNAMFRRRFGFYGLFSYDRTFDNVHHVTGSLLGYGSNFKQTNDFQGVKQSHLGLQINYIYNKKYMVDFSSNYANSVKLPEGNRGGFSPSLGLAWMMSSEDFMASADNVDYLKLRLSGGILNSDLPIGGFFYYDNRYGGSGSYQWFEGNRSRGGTSSSWSDNPNLGFAKRNEVTFGFDGLFFNKVLGVEANAFYELYSDLVTRPTTIYPSFYTPYIPYENFEEDAYKGVEVGFDLNKSFGDLNLVVGINALYVTSERKVVDEVYDNDYQYRQGHPRDASFGLEAIGLFRDQADIDNSPIQAFGAVQPGDIKYKDQNNDGIVDGNDEVYLRRWQAPFSGGLDIKLSYKNLTLYVLGEGRSGSETFMEGDYYWVDGNDKYSEVVRGSWTPETVNTATYPRLSAESDNNNFRRSSYWLYNNDYFNIRKIQLTYNLPQMAANALFMKKMMVYVDASDIYQFAKNRDKRDLRVGGEPYSRTFSLGVKANF